MSGQSSKENYTQDVMSFTKRHNFRTVFAGWLILVSLGSLYADGVFSVQLKRDNRVDSIPAEEIRGRLWLSASKLATLYGALPPKTTKQELVFEFNTHTVTMNMDKSTYKIRQARSRAWARGTFERRAYKDQGQIMIPLSAVPDFLNQSFTYHWQKKELTEKEKTEKKEEHKHIALEYKRQKNIMWLPLKPLAEALSCVVFLNQSKEYQMVMPDFSILTLKIGDNWIFRRNTQFVRLDKPIILLAGEPHISLDSVPLLFGIDLQFDTRLKQFRIPKEYLRTNKVIDINKPHLLVQGFKPQGFQFELKEFSAFYQNPIPIFPAEHLDQYESVRDFLTNEPIRPLGSDLDHVNGEMSVGMSGHTAEIPFAGNGLLEKLGSRTRLANGNLSWGFPLFKVEGSRAYEYNGFNNQFNLLDRVTLSHSNDHFGDRDANPQVDMEASYGQQKFGVFLSTSQFSQSVEYLQTFGTAELSSTWNFDRGNRLGFRLNHYYIENEIRTVSSVFNDQNFFVGGGGESLTVDTTSQLTLAGTVLSDRHMVSTLDLNYQKEGVFEFETQISGSEYKEPATSIKKDQKTFDYDALVKTVWKKNRSRVEVQYEQVGDDYRSLGDPLRYQARKIFRITPYLDLTRVWKVYGEARKEHSRSLVPQGLNPFTSQYSSLTNVFSFKTNVIRLAGNELRSTLFGRRVSGSADYTHYFGRDSLDLGATLTHQWFTNDEMFRRSPGGKLSYQILRPKWRFSLGEEYTYHNYVFNDVRRYESLSSMFLQVGNYQTLAQYEIKPRYFLEEDRLYTGLLRFGRKISDKNSLNVVFAATSLRPELKEPDVVRAGLELLQSF